MISLRIRQSIEKLGLQRVKRCSDADSVKNNISWNILVKCQPNLKPIINTRKVLSFDNRQFFCFCISTDSGLVLSKHYQNFGLNVWWILRKSKNLTTKLSINMFGLRIFFVAIRVKESDAMIPQLRNFI